MNGVDFSKYPEAMLDAAFPYFAINKKMPEALKEEIKTNLKSFMEVPESRLIGHIDQYLDCNIFDVDFEDLVETGLYNVIYQLALTIPFKKKD